MKHPGPPTYVSTYIHVSTSVHLKNDSKWKCYSLAAVDDVINFRCKRIINKSTYMLIIHMELLCSFIYSFRPYPQQRWRVITIS